LQRFSASCNHPLVPPRELTYEDLLQIVELIKSASHFSEFRLKVGDIEVSLRRSDGAATPRTAPQQPTLAEAQPAASAVERIFPEGMTVVRAPMVGTFYRGPSPGAPPYVEVGSAVEPESQVGIIEVMKLRNAIVASARGVVKEILAANAEPLEHGQPLMLIEPRRSASGSSTSPCATRTSACGRRA
jgi:acetyl-CoA carboxylase biotin carboxyl carrier protein